MIETPVQVIERLSSSAPAIDSFAISKSDTVDLPYPVRAIFVGGTGDVKVRTFAGTDIVYPAVPAGTKIVIVATRVFSTGTTATAMVGEK